MQSMQSTTSKHVKRKLKRRRLLWKDPILANVIATSTGGTFQGIDGVDRKLRTSNVALHKVTPKMQESDPDLGKYQSVNPIAHHGQFRSNNKQNSSKTGRQTNHDIDTSQRAFSAKLIKLIKEVRQEVSPAPTPPEFIFKVTEEAALKTFLVLKKYNFDLEKAINEQKSSPLGYGS
jgi:hypothetical protein